MYKQKFSDEELMRRIPCSRKELEMFKAVQRKALKDAEAYKKKLFSKQIKIIGVSGSMRRADDCPQAESTSEFLLKAALKKAEQLGAKTELIKLRDFEMMPCKGCYSTTNAQCHFPCTCYPYKTKYADDITDKLYWKVLDADGIIWATPIHSFKISSLMSILIDRLISMDGSLSPANPNDAKNKGLNIKHTRFIELTADNNVFGSGFLKRHYGKVAGIIVSGHEAGASMAISSLYMTLNHYGMIFPPWSNMYAMGSILDATYKDKSRIESKEYAEEAAQVAENVFNAVKMIKQNPKLVWKYDQSRN